MVSGAAWRMFICFNRLTCGNGELVGVHTRVAKVGSRSGAAGSAWYGEDCVK